MGIRKISDLKPVLAVTMLSSGNHLLAQDFATSEIAVQWGRKWCRGAKRTIGTCYLRVTLAMPSEWYFD